ncbi:DUF305 domain-containing protein [Streptomyces sp. A3M-1-3]|uniref:DUF305 domain-containing protein n=1 Tax=Streptomyces sp. A3M-1-3 TaxID=2962044 RepID=UPI0020B6ED48|nr:DUF305 domain-containing protein [Streptomyces sp. A3M-1-3]MCP3817533.1 DUF305 domain-containing protein [Streptomyces sp. A3M-1-3]
MTRALTRTHWAAITAVVLALLVAAAATVATARGGASSEQAGAAAAPAEDSADAGFARDMAVHHQQAVEMSFIVRDRTKDEDVRRLAYDIANTQANQRGMLLGWLDLWELPKISMGEPMAWMASEQAQHGGHSGGHSGGHAGASGGDGGASGGHEVRDGSLMPGMATKTELAALARAEGKQAEILYLQLMTDHHKGGVTMARGCADLCEVGTERKLAQGMADAQESELALLADLLKQRGAKPRA